MNEEIQSVLETAYTQPVQIRSSHPVSGGCINETLALSLSNGDKVFVKHNARPPQDFFLREAEGLKLLASAPNGPRIPKVLGLQSGSNPRFLILEFIEEGSPGADYHSGFAHALAAMHRVTQDHFGLNEDNYIGTTQQSNSPEADGLVFFREHRLRFQQKLARDRGGLPAGIDHKIDRLCDRLEELLDLEGERPALVHGDLWSGNHFADSQNRSCLVDPAVYFGLRETDLAMSELFGRLPQKFYDAYDEVFPLNPGYETRKPIYNLYHLLNHVNLFGSSYLGSTESTLNYFVG